MNVREFFAAHDGAQIPGGCDGCDAYQTVRIDGDGIIHLSIHHDDWCPRLKTHRESGGAS